MTHRAKIASIVAAGLVGMMAGMAPASAGGGGHCDTTDSRGTQVQMSGACFTPTTLFTEPGETIAFVNLDPYKHNVSGKDWGMYEGMGRGDRYTTSFADEGVYAYACTYHPGMTGSIVVGKGAGPSAAGEPDPIAASAVPTSGGDGWIAAGAIGLVLGAAAGTGLTAWRRRSSA